jgi:hypothetical protein
VALYSIVAEEKTLTDTQPEKLLVKLERTQCKITDLILTSTHSV